MGGLLICALKQNQKGSVSTHEWSSTCSPKEMLLGYPSWVAFCIPKINTRFSHGRHEGSEIKIAAIVIDDGVRCMHSIDKKGEL
jgi:hypothetical protein